MRMMLKRRRAQRPAAWFVTMTLLLPVLLIGCGGKGGNGGSIPPPIDDAPGASSGSGMSTQPMQPAQKPGMSNGKKVAVALAGAALLYYLYKHHQKQQGQEVQYYRSEKNGRIYYRDPQTHQPHYLTPPPGGYQLDPQEQQELSRYQGYNGSATGDDYKAPSPDTGAPPQE